MTGDATLGGTVCCYFASLVFFFLKTKRAAWGILFLKNKRQVINFFLNRANPLGS